MPDLNFEKDLAIDLDNLHEEWRSHARTRYNYACEVSHLERATKKAHENAKVVRSKLIKEAKEKGAGNATLQEAYYRDHEDHTQAKDTQINAEYDLSMAWNALNAFDNRKSALENEVKLWSRNYFATPTEHRSAEPGKRIGISVMNAAKEEKVQEGRAAVNKQRKHR